MEQFFLARIINFIYFNVICAGIFLYIQREEKDFIPRDFFLISTEMLIILSSNYYQTIINISHIGCFRII